MSRNILDEYRTDREEVETSEETIELGARRTVDDLCDDLVDLVPDLREEDLRQRSYSDDYTGLKRSALVRLVEVFAELDRKDLLDEVDEPSE